MGTADRRRYIRHPSDIPITYMPVHRDAYQENRLRNISIGGLCFRSSSYLEQGLTLLIRIPFVHPEFEGKAVVVWCRRGGKAYEVGVRFVDNNTSFRIRMVEQVCHVEQYKREVLDVEGRQLSSEEAALEWIQKFAQDFPE